MRVACRAAPRSSCPVFDCKTALAQYCVIAIAFYFCDFGSWCVREPPRTSQSNLEDAFHATWHSAKFIFASPMHAWGARGAGDAWKRGMGGGLGPVQRRMDLQSIGLCPQGFESSRCKTWRGRVTQYRSGAPDLGARAPSAANRVIVSAQNSGGVGARRACMHKGEGRYGAERGRERLSRTLARRPFSLAYINTHVTDTSWYTCTKLCVCT